MKADGDAVFTNLTNAVLPCQKAHVAYSSAMSVTCGETGVFHRFLGFVYVLALNMLFLVFLYFALFNLSFFQGIIIRQVQNNIKRSDDFTN